MELDARYTLAPDQVIVRIPPPFPPERLEFYRVKAPRGQVAAQPNGPYSMVLHSRPDGLTIWAQAFGCGSGFTIGSVVEYTLRLYQPEIEATEEVLHFELAGDLVVRPEAGEEHYLHALKGVIAQGWPTLRLVAEFREVDRTVVTLAGPWAFNPVDGIASERRQLELYGSHLNTNRSVGGGGTGTVRDFAGWLGRWIGNQVVVEADALPARVSWHLNDLGNGSPESRASAHDRGLVLNHLYEQTGLKWSEQTRRVRRLFIEMADDSSRVAG